MPPSERLGHSAALCSFRGIFVQLCACFLLHSRSCPPRRPTTLSPERAHAARRGQRRPRRPQPAAAPGRHDARPRRPRLLGDADPPRRLHPRRARPRLARYGARGPLFGENLAWGTGERATARAHRPRLAGEPRSPRQPAAARLDPDRDRRPHRHVPRLRRRDRRHRRLRRLAARSRPSGRGAR